MLCSIEVKRTRARPACVVRAKGAVEEVGKVSALVDGGDIVIINRVVHSSNTQDDFDTLGFTVGDICLEALAVVQQFRRLVIEASVISSPAVGSKVHAGITSGIRGTADEAQRDRINTAITVWSDALGR